MANELAAGLRAASDKIRTLLGNITKNAFEIGQVLNRVKATEAWSVGYESFDTWVNIDTGLGISTANRLMKVATSFSKEEYVGLMSLGKTKIFLLASAPEEDRRELAKAARHGDVEKLEKAVLRARASRGEPVRKRTNKEDRVVEFARWVASLPCLLGEKCKLNESANSGEYCAVHAARSVLAGSRIGKKMLRRIS